MAQAESVEQVSESTVTQDLQLEDCINSNCPWSNKIVTKESLTLFNGNIVGFCNSGCRDKFAADPSKYPDIVQFFKNKMDKKIED